MTKARHIQDKETLTNILEPYCNGSDDVVGIHIVGKNDTHGDGVWIALDEIDDFIAKFSEMAKQCKGEV